MKRRRRPVEKRAKTKNQARRKRRRRSEKVKASRHIPMKRRRNIATQALLMASPLPSQAGEKGRKTSRNMGKSTIAAANRPEAMPPLDPRSFPRCTRLVPGMKSSNHLNTLLRWTTFLPSRRQRATGKHATTILTVTTARGRRPRTLDSIAVPLALGTSARLLLATKRGGNRHLDTGTTHLSLPTGGGETLGHLSDGGSDIQGLPLVTTPGHRPLGDIYLVLPTGAPGHLSPVETTPVLPHRAEGILEVHPGGTTPLDLLSEPRGAPCGIPQIVHAPGLHTTESFPVLQLVRDIEITVCRRMRRLGTVPRRDCCRRIASVV